MLLDKRQVQSISAIRVVVLHFLFELLSTLRLHCVVLIVFSIVEANSPQVALQLWKEEVKRREIRRVVWMLKEALVPGIKHVKLSSRDRIVMHEENAVLQQLSTLLSDSLFQFDSLGIRPVDSRACRLGPVEWNSDVHELQRVLYPDRCL